MKPIARILIISILVYIAALGASTQALATDLPTPQQVFDEVCKQEPNCPEKPSPIFLDASSWMIAAYAKGGQLQVPFSSLGLTRPSPIDFSSIDYEFGLPKKGTFGGCVPPEDVDLEIAQRQAGAATMKWFARRGIYPVNSVKARIADKIPKLDWSSITGPVPLQLFLSRKKSRPCLNSIWMSGRLAGLDQSP